MTVYVESNFVLELAYLQEEHESCEAIVLLAAKRSIELVMPAFCVTEARSSRAKRAHSRREFHIELEKNVRELCRSQPYQKLADTTVPFTTALIESAEAEKKRLESAGTRLLQVCRIPTQAATVQSAIQCEEKYGLAAADAVVFASILGDLSTKPPGAKCFLNRNSRDFVNPDIEGALKEHDCRLIPSFKDGLGYVRSIIAEQPAKITSSRGQRAGKRSRPPGPGG